MKDNSLDILDILTILSFVIQMQNQEKLFSIRDIQEDNNRVAQDIHKHLQSQDERIDLIMRKLGVGENEVY